MLLSNRRNSKRKPSTGISQKVEILSAMEILATTANDIVHAFAVCCIFPGDGQPHANSAVPSTRLPLTYNVVPTPRSPMLCSSNTKIR